MLLLVFLGRGERLPRAAAAPRGSVGRAGGERAIKRCSERPKRRLLSLALARSLRQMKRARRESVSGMETNDATARRQVYMQRSFSSKDAHTPFYFILI